MRKVWPAAESPQKTYTTQEEDHNGSKAVYKRVACSGQQHVGFAVYWMWWWNQWRLYQRKDQVREHVRRPHQRLGQLRGLRDSLWVWAGMQQRRLQGGLHRRDDGLRRRLPRLDLRAGELRRVWRCLQCRRRLLERQVPALL
jgi:hypothetical protein